MYKVSIFVPSNAQAGVFVTLNRRRAEILKITERVGMQFIKIHAYLPVKESFGFIEMLRKNTGGKAFPRMKFSHWQLVGGDPFKEGSSANKIAMDIRKRKGLKDVLPKYGDYSNRW